MDKPKFLSSLGVDDLKQQSKDILVALEIAKEERDNLSDDLHNATETVEQRKAGLILTEEYGKGKNAEIRDAWLTQQRQDDKDYGITLIAVERICKLLEDVNREIESLANQFANNKADKRMNAALLRFMADD